MYSFVVEDLDDFPATHLARIKGTMLVGVMNVGMPGYIDWSQSSALFRPPRCRPSATYLWGGSGVYWHRTSHASCTKRLYGGCVGMPEHHNCNWSANRLAATQWDRPRHAATQRNEASTRRAANQNIEANQRPTRITPPVCTAYWWTFEYGQVEASYSISLLLGCKAPSRASARHGMNRVK